MEPRNKDDHLGLRNVKIALDLLQEEGIALVTQDVGGQYGRKVIFNTHDGSCMVRPL
jgi:chemotaxis protein CheD